MVRSMFRVRTLGTALVAVAVTALAACEPSASSDHSPGGPYAAAPSTQPIPPGPDGKVHLTNAQWKARLTPEQYHILREQGTERPFSNAYDATFAKGEYVCAACGQELFASDQKYDSGCGWPAFSSAVAGFAVTLVPDPDGERTEVECSRCGGHLGHVFDDGPPPSHQRFCIDSAAIRFVPAGSPPAQLLTATAAPATMPAAH